MKIAANQHVPYDPEKETFLNNFYCRFPEGPGSKHPDGLTRFTYQAM